LAAARSAQPQAWLADLCGLKYTVMILLDAQPAIQTDQAYLAWIERYRSAWRRCMNHFHTAATGLMMTYHHDPEAKIV
jgi:hypothetical protein